jgi:hypothetical protein
MHYLVLPVAVDALLKATVEGIGLEKMTRTLSLVGYKTNSGKTTLRYIRDDMSEML